MVSLPYDAIFILKHFMALAKLPKMPIPHPTSEKSPGGINSWTLSRKLMTRLALRSCASESLRFEVGIADAACSLPFFALAALTFTRAGARSLKLKQL